LSNGNRADVVAAFKAAAETCPLPPAIDLIGEKWAFLMIRGAMTGLKHFEEFQAALGIARNILSDRLAKLVAGGVLERTPDPADGRRIVYTLTAKGHDLLPTMVALRQWAGRHGHGSASVILTDRVSGRAVQTIKVLAEDGRELELDDLAWIDMDAREVKATRTAAA
jgi:DNA-binding HxlR family transcriptional regulator